MGVDSFEAINVVQPEARNVTSILSPIKFRSKALSATTESYFTGSYSQLDLLELEGASEVRAQRPGHTFNLEINQLRLAFA